MLLRRFHQPRLQNRASADFGFRIREIEDWPGLERLSWSARAHGEKSNVSDAAAPPLFPSLERGVIGSRLRSIEKSSDCVVVAQPEAG